MKSLVFSALALIGCLAFIMGAVAVDDYSLLLGAAGCLLVSWWALGLPQ